MRDRPFWILAMGVFPALLLGLLVVQFLDVPALLRTPAALALLVAEAAVLPRVVDPAVVGTLARARRVALGLALSVLIATLVGGLLFAVILVVAFGNDG